MSLAYKQCFDYFMLGAGMEHGDNYCLPYSGGMLEQPAKTLRMWMLFRGELTAHIAKENKKSLDDMKRKSGRRR